MMSCVQELAEIRRLGPCKRYRWKDYDRKTGRIYSEGILFVEMEGRGEDDDHRCFFICHYHVNEEWMKVSRSGWHGRFEILILEKGDTHLLKFVLAKFRYCGMAASWHHDMEFTWNPSRQVYFNTHCSCFEQLCKSKGATGFQQRQYALGMCQKRHFHIIIWEMLAADLEEWGSESQLPDLFEKANWKWVQKLPRSFREPAPPMPSRPVPEEPVPVPLMLEDGISGDGPEEKDVPPTALSLIDWANLNDEETWTLLFQCAT